jgi:hypothetical protein
MWTRPTIVLGADTHESSNTIAAVTSATGEVLGVPHRLAGVVHAAGGLPGRGSRARCA